MRSFRLAFVALAFALVLSVGFNVVLSLRLLHTGERPAAVAPATRYALNDDHPVALSLSDLTSAALEHPSLLELAKSDRYSGATEAKRESLVETWTVSNFSSMYDQLDRTDQRRFVKRLEKELDDMLAERSFGSDEL